MASSWPPLWRPGQTSFNPSSSCVGILKVGFLKYGTSELGATSRNRLGKAQPHAGWHFGSGTHLLRRAEGGAGDGAVSYTHLTLPTILRV